MASHQLACCGIQFGFIIGVNQPAHPLNEVVLTAADHRHTTSPRPRLRIPFPLHYSSNILLQIHDFCTRHLSLPPCCVDGLLPHFVAAIHAAINGFHPCSGLVPVHLHIFPPVTNHDRDHESAALRESFEAASPKPTPASMESISKLVEDSMNTGGGDDDWEKAASTCAICLDDIETRKSSVKMPCSHVFHRDCIVGWLKNSHLCPLCRYQMPVSSASAAH